MLFLKKKSKKKETAAETPVIEKQEVYDEIYVGMTSDCYIQSGTMENITKKKKSLVDKLVGSQIVKMSKDGILLKKNGKTIMIKALGKEERGCNKIASDMYYSPLSDNNPVITSVEIEQGHWECDWSGDSCQLGSGERVLITFFGESAPIARYNISSACCGGWNYGCIVKLECSELDIHEDILEW